MAKNPIPLKVKNLASSIKNLISIHEEKTSSSIQKGHAKAGGAPQTIGASLSAGTDNGYYARADHIHTVNYDTILNKPTTFNPAVHSHNDIYYTKSEIDDLLDTLILDNITLDENGDLIIGSTITGLLLTSNQNTIQENETTTLTATAYDAYSNIVINEPIQLYKDGVLINIFNTDNNGQISYTYNGNGSGKHEFIARNGKVVSGTLNVWDYLFYDDGITTPKTANWTNYSDRLTVSVDETGTTLARDASSGAGYYLTPSAYSTPFAIEFEIIAISNKTSNGIDFAVNGSDNNKTFNALNISSGDTVKITYDGETIRAYRNGSTTPYELALDLTEDITIAFVVAPNQSIKFKNFRMYSI